jgi:type IV secretion system protein TrbL
VMVAFDVMGGALIFMMCCWQIPKLFAAVMGGSPALTGGDLVATAAVVGGGALAVGGVAAAGVGALAGGGGGAAAGTGSAASAGSAGSGTTAAVALVGSVGAGSSGGAGLVSPPASPSPSSLANEGGVRRQPDPPLNGAGNGGVGINTALPSSDRHGSTARTDNVSSGSAAAPGSALTASRALSSIGGEQLAGSGFETQSAQRGFAPTSVSASSASATPASAPFSPSTARGAMGGDSVVSAPMESAGPSELAGAGGSSVASGIASVGSVGTTNPQPPGNVRTGGTLSRAADQVRGFRRRLGQIPSDAAPHATPPRIPIEHEE